jgi:hypothetical protein
MHASAFHFLFLIQHLPYGAKSSSFKLNSYCARKRNYWKHYRPYGTRSRLSLLLGYKKLRIEDLSYRHSEGVLSSFETLEHIYGLAEVIRNTGHF